MASITIDERKSWMVAGWAFRRLIARACDEVSQPEDLLELDQAPALGGLHLNLLADDQRSRLTRAVCTAANSIRGDLAATASRDLRDREYAEALEELEGLLGCEGAT